MHAILAFCLATIPHQTLCIVDPCLKKKEGRGKGKKNKTIQESISGAYYQLYSGVERASMSVTALPYC